MPVEQFLEITMSRRTLSLAVAVLWMSAAGPVAAQNLEAGKSPAQIFASTCAVCHKGPHGLLKSVPAGSLPSFLRQHYTTSVEMAGAMSAYVLSNGGANRRAGDDLTREGRESRTLPKRREPEERQERRLGAEKPARGHVAKPKEDGAPEADVKKPKVDKRKPKNAPAKDEPKDTSRPKSDESKPEAPAENTKPATAPEKPAEPAAQPEAKPADNAPVKKPDEDKPASSNMPVFNIEPKSEAKPDSKPADAPAAPATSPDKAPQ